VGTRRGGIASGTARIGTVAFCTAVLVAGGLLLPAAALAAFPGTNGLIAWSKPSFVRPAEIWVVHPDGTRPHSVARTGQTDFAPAWSADGRHIAFASSGSDVDIWVMTARGKHARNVTNDPNNPDLDPSWSPDGGRIAFWKQNFDQTGSVWVIDADGTDPVQLTNDAHTNQQPAWSPDGSTIAFVSNRNGSNELYLMNPDGSNVRRITDTPTTWEENPNWSPDGTRLAYDACVSDTYPCPGTPNNEIYSIKKNGLGRRTLTDFAGIDANPAWSPDGTRIVFRSDRAGDSQLFTMAAIDGSDVQQVTFKNLTGATDPDWQPRP
jgi:Tol biopolymer transport system component